MSMFYLNYSEGTKQEVNIERIGSSKPQAEPCAVRRVHHCLSFFFTCWLIDQDWSAEDIFVMNTNLRETQNSM